MISQGITRWKAWYNDNEPERQSIPGNYQPRFEADSNGDFYRMLLVRSLREDRTILCVDDFISRLDCIDVAGTKLTLHGYKIRTTGHGNFGNDL